MSNILTQLVEELNAGKLKVVDLTQPLGTDTPVIGLPPIFASSPGFSIEQISRYDDKGPGWYWNTIQLGEHTGTHFDAPIHWITGRDLPDNSCDSIPPRNAGPRMALRPFRPKGRSMEDRSGIVGRIPCYRGHETLRYSSPPAPSP